MSVPSKTTKYKKEEYKPQRLVFGYVRVSTQKQVDKESIRTQTAAIEEYCKRNDLRLVITYKDEGFSAKTFERPGVQELFSRVQSGDIIICYQTSRFVRDSLLMMNKLKELRDKNISVVFLDAPIVSPDPLLRDFMLWFLAYFSEMERAKIGQRTSDALQHMKAEGRLITKPHFGWMANKTTGEDGKSKTTLVENPEEQEIIKLIRAYVEDEPNISYSDICRRLTDDQVIIPKTRKAKAWHITMVKNIIRHNNIRPVIIIPRKCKHDKEQEGTTTEKQVDFD